MWIVIGLVVGGWLGAWGSVEDLVGGVILGGLVGCVVQLVLRRPRADAGRIEALEARVGELERALEALKPAGMAAPVPPAETAAAAAPPPVVAPEPSPSMAAVEPEWPEPVIEPAPPARVRRRGIDVLAGATSAPVAGEPSTLDALYARARAWLLGGNTVVRVGLLVLFFGLAFLARYAVEHSLLPVELRLSGIAAGAIALLVVGWRLRAARPGYALSLQGGGVAVLYLTIFAAMRLYGLIPATAGFALLLAVVAFSVVLALAQRAQALAVIGTLGGFLAPILASTGEGSHVMLFSYYLLLNAGVLAVAWKQAWRGLNLTGFLFTFSIALAWGARDYRPEQFATTEPFLIAFFLMYVAAAVLYAWRSAPELRHAVDGTLVFGTPVVGFGLQAALVHDMPYGLAWSALAVGGGYVLLARWLHGRARPSLRLLVEAFVALGVAFLTLTIPLALDGRWTGAAWALEGAALFWVGTRQHRRLAIAAGLLLLLGAGVCFLGDSLFAPRADWPVLNSQCLGAALVAVAGFVSAQMASHTRAQWPRVFRVAPPALLVWATLWWVGGGLAEIDAWIGRADAPAAALAFMALSAGLATALAERRGWALLHWPGLLALPGMALALLMAADARVMPLAGWGALAWPLAAVAVGWALRRAEGAAGFARVLAPAHVAALWLLTLAVARTVARVDLPGTMWNPAAVMLSLLLPVWLIGRLGARWPVVRWRPAYGVVGCAGLLVAGLLWALSVSLGGGGSPAPLPYLPLLNPLDLGIALLLLSGVRWWRRTRADLAVDARLVPGVLGGAAFVLASLAVVRAVHHLGAVPWEAHRLFASDTVQASLSLFWGVLGLVLTFLASRGARRLLWMIGAALLGGVVLKLFLVDMASTGTVARIVSFIGAGVLLLVVGYFSPLPPAREVHS
ncbi:DUF2339 domain-containing protein [Nitrogeniibacter mangrovi]|uniref:DUF2339 domain-containing protein n=1 Tax=Nitrogeniibacter mangrovi TaxID=2016596 RepID=A0A6C1AZE7_9RHOO|nr:DUF2339 domain-containing protein [Nitrogeniibacter mangrovi]QID16741.1 DUF2339 domain-containing protein [Nitrogeniibacter mangrovi]